MRTYPLPQDDQELRSSLKLDSVDLVGLVMRIEREFRVRLSPEELATVQRVGDLLDLMEAKLAERPDAFIESPRRASAQQQLRLVSSERSRSTVQCSADASPNATIATPAVITSVPTQRAVPTSSCR